jgi:hypothetical protein
MRDHRHWLKVYSKAIRTSMREYTCSLLLVATIAYVDNFFVYLLRLYLIRVSSCILLVRAVGTNDKWLNANPSVSMIKA